MAFKYATQKQARQHAITTTTNFGLYVMTTASEWERLARESYLVEGGVVDLRSGDDGPILPPCDPHQAP